MTGLLFVTAQSTDVKDLNRVLLYLRDWDTSSAASCASTPLDPRAHDSIETSKSHSAATVQQQQQQQFHDRFRFVTRHDTRALISRSSSSSSFSPAAESAHGTFPPVPPSATFANSWVGASVEEIEDFVDALAARELRHGDDGDDDDKSDDSRSRDSGYSTSSSSSSSSSSSLTMGSSSAATVAAAAGADKSPCGGWYNTGMYLVVDEAGLATGTATLACRRRRHRCRSRATASSSWDRVRGVPWAEVCSAWKAVERSGSVDVLFGQHQQQQQRQNKKEDMISAPNGAAASRWLDYSRSAGDHVAPAPRDCWRRDMEVRMWHECGLV
ncbi:hypothetical protein MN608_00414 [Microdochium nivale]|nr:hypothetical protein MN608_00414 [Microdochium nivale]